MGIFGNTLFANANNAANATANNTPKAAEPQTAPTAPVVKEKYVAPQSATEAKQRIEAAIEAGRVKQVPSSEDGQLQFIGKTFALQQAFRMLGGSFDKSASIWSVPSDNWQNPEQCADLVQNELDKQAKRDESREAFEKRVNEEAAKRVKVVLTKLASMTEAEINTLISKIA